MRADGSLASVMGEDFEIEPSPRTESAASRDLGPHLEAWRSSVGSVAFTEVASIDIEPMAQAVGSVMRMPMIRLIEAGVLALSVPSQSIFYPASEAEASELMPKSTVLVTSLAGASEVLAGYVSHLASVTGKFTSVALYCSRPDSAKFDWHVDNWLSFIVQINGVKIFDIRANQEAAVQECVLSPGQGLIMDSLTRHRTRTLSPSIHLSFSIHDDQRSA